MGRHETHDGSHAAEDERLRTQLRHDPVAAGAEAPLVRFAGAGGKYFETMGIQLQRGRFFDRIEEEQGLPNVIISRSAASLLFPGEYAIAKQIRPATGGDSKTWFNVIGVVEDVLIDDLRRTSP
jgi:hypothetical protein